MKEVEKENEGREWPRARKPVGVTVGQVRQNPELRKDLIPPGQIPLPELPPSESPLDILCTPVSLWSKDFTDLVLKWKVSQEEAGEVYRSWVYAKRQLRRLRTSAKRRPPLASDVFDSIRHEFWENRWLDKPVSARIEALSETLRAAEESGHPISLKQVQRLLLKPKIPEAKQFLEWLVRHWISPEEGFAPLCLCSDGQLDEIIELTPSLRGINPPVGESVRQAIHEAGLHRAKSEELPKGRAFR